MGPFGGRALQTGDVLPVGTASGRLRFVEPRPLTFERGRVTLRVVAGPHVDRFNADALDALCGGTFIVTPDSNRMAYRLAGPVLGHTRGADILSEGTPMGSLQVPSSGQPILLMADAQTTGGYTIIGVVITADLPLAGQLAPGDRISFAVCSREDALAALVEREAALA
jgi:antagonist of KipI